MAKRGRPRVYTQTPTPEVAARRGGTGKVMFIGLAIGAPGADYGHHEDY